MKIRADEHFSPLLVDAVSQVALRDGWEFTSVLDTGYGGASDPHWVRAFAAEGGGAIISGDSDFCKVYPQIKAVFDTGLKVIHLPPKWSTSTGDLKAAFVFQWWKRIEETIESMRPRECYRPKWNISIESELEKVRLDFHKAEKRYKRALKRGES